CLAIRVPPHPTLLPSTTLFRSYTILLVLVTILPYLSGMSGLIYLAAALSLGGIFLYYAIRMRLDESPRLPMRVFKYSINYLMLLFAALLLDHYFKVTFGL